jgi:hypothetical protein
MKGCGDEDDEVERTGRRVDENQDYKMRMRMKTGKRRANDGSQCVPTLVGSVWEFAVWLNRIQTSRCLGGR